MRVTDPGKFMQEIVGTDGEFTADEISFQLRNIIVQGFAHDRGLGDPGPRHGGEYPAVGQLVAKAISPTVASYGLTIPEFYIENISLPDEVEKMLDKRTSMGIVGDLEPLRQYAASEAMLNASNQPGGMGAVSARPGAEWAWPWAGCSAAHGAACPSRLPPAGAADPAAAEPETVWHIAVGWPGRGALWRAKLGPPDANEGKFTRERWSGRRVRTAGKRTRSTNWRSFSPSRHRRPAAGAEQG